MDTELSLKLFVVLCRTFSTVSSAAKQDIKNYDLSLSEFGALELLYHKGPQTVQNIAKKVLLTSGSITYVIDQLVKKGFAVRTVCAEDKRITLVALSNSGTHLLATIFPQHAHCLSQLFSSLSSEEIIHLTAMLKQISKSAQELQEKK